MKKYLLSLWVLLVPVMMHAGTPKVSLEGSLMISSTYIWRGGAMCGFHFNPDVSLNIGNFCIDHSSYITPDGSYKEIDFDLSYTLGDFSIHIADYYWHSNDDPEVENFFNWKKESTRHFDEVSLVYDSSAIPLKVSWFTFLWGDWIPDDNGDRGKMSFSSFLELEVWHEFGPYGRGAFILGTSILPGSYTDYSRSFMPVHIGLNYSKSFDLGFLSIPVGIDLVFNPYSRQCLAAASLGLAF